MIVAEYEKRINLLFLKTELNTPKEGHVNRGHCERRLTLSFHYSIACWFDDRLGKQFKIL